MKHVPKIFAAVGSRNLRHIFVLIQPLIVTNKIKVETSGNNYLTFLEVFA